MSGAPGSFQPESRRVSLRDGDVVVEAAGRRLPLLGRGGPETELRPVRAFLEGGGETGEHLPVLLGMGLGHGLEHLLAEYDGPVAVLDAEADIDALSGCRKRFEDAPRVFLVDAADAETALTLLTRWQMDHGGRPLSAVVHPAYPRIAPDLYLRVRDAIRASGSYNFWARARYPKFREWPPRILLVSSSYFLIGEVQAACERMDVPHRFLDLGDKEFGRDEFVQELLTAVLDFKPDFVFTLNHLGVDREGVLADLLARLELPLASWFVDNPHLILYHYANLDSQLTAIFTWDRDNIDSLRERGFPSVHYLPLGVDTHRFRPPSGPVARGPLAADVSFVGNSMLAKVAHRLKAARPPRELILAYPEIAAAFARDEERSVEDFLRNRYPHLVPAYESLDAMERRLSFETLVTWESTRQYRLSCVEQTLGFAPLIVGDRYWKTVLRHRSEPWRYHRELSYYSDLPHFYPQTTVNFNCTSKQMKGAVNQRVFDVPACGAFLLTDHREQLEDLFEIGREVVCFREPDEVPELLDRYLHDAPARQRVMEAARRRILAEHTYEHRLTGLMHTMRELYG